MFFIFFSKKTFSVWKKVDDESFLYDNVFVLKIVLNTSM